MLKSGPDRPTGSGRSVIFFALAVMHRRYLSCTVSRCAELPLSLNPSKRKHPSPVNRPNLEKFKNIKPDPRKKKDPKRFDNFKLDVLSDNQIQGDAERLASERRPARERKISKQSLKIAQATSYKLLRDVAFSETIVEGARGDRVLRSMVERAEARAMVQTESKTSETPVLGLPDEVFQHVSFAPGTFIEARRFVFSLKSLFLHNLTNVPLYPETNCPL